MTIADIAVANSVLASALFTSQAALKAAAENVFASGTTATVMKDEVAHLAIAASHFAACFPGRRDLLEAHPVRSIKMALKIFEKVSEVKTSILRDHPAQSGAGLISGPELVRILTEEISQEEYDATVPTAGRSAAIFFRLVVSYFSVPQDLPLMVVGARGLVALREATVEDFPGATLVDGKVSLGDVLGDNGIGDVDIEDDDPR